MNLFRAVSVTRFILLTLCVILVVSIAFCGFPDFWFFGMDGVFEEGNIRLGLDLAGGSVITYEAISDTGSVTKSGMDNVEKVMRYRLDNMGYSEALVYVVGDNLLRVEIPGIDDPAEAAETLGATAALEFRDYEGNVFLSGTEVKKASGMSIQDDDGTIKDIVSLEFSALGAKKFENATERISGLGNSNNYISIYLDENEISHATVSSKISGGNAQIEGLESLEKCVELANLINGGSLDYDLSYEGERGGLSTVSASLGDKALSSSILAGAIGLALVILFMIIVYKLPGVISGLILLAYTGIIGIILVITGANLTLPGIAGIILSIGMAVDANVVVYERIKEEIRNGKSVKAAIESGFKNAFSAILDSNVTTLIAAGVLWYFGSGSIQGFAITLFYGIVVSLFTSLILTKAYLRVTADMGFTKISSYGVKSRENNG